MLRSSPHISLLRYVAKTALAGVILLALGSCAKVAPSQPPDNVVDTTSHNFVWQVQTLGDGTSSTLYDVAIINDTLAYAVGELYLSDSTGQIDPIAYSLAVWNGSSWKLRRLFYSGNNLIARIRGVFPVGANDVWLAAGGVFHWDGVASQAELKFSRLSLPDPNATVERLWSSFNGNLYGVGNVGTIVCYNGTSWQKLSSGTTVDLRDIWGSWDSRTGHETILAVASFRFAVPQGMALLKIQGHTVSQVDTAGLPLDLSGVWSVPGGGYYVVGDGVYHSQTPGPPWIADRSFPLIYEDAIRGNGPNDILVAGAYGLIYHFNGRTWKNYLGKELAQFYGEYHSVSVKGNLVVAVGWMDDRAVILMGRRLAP